MTHKSLVGVQQQASKIVLIVVTVLNKDRQLFTRTMPVDQEVANYRLRPRPYMVCRTLLRGITGC